MSLWMKLERLVYGQTLTAPYMSLAVCCGKRKTGSGDAGWGGPRGLSLQPLAAPSQDGVVPGLLAPSRAQFAVVVSARVARPRQA